MRRILPESAREAVKAHVATVAAALLLAAAEALAQDKQVKAAAQEGPRPVRRVVVAAGQN
jgi:uncharacterized membrane protein